MRSVETALGMSRLQEKETQAKMKVEERALLTANQFYLSKEVRKKATEQGFHSLLALPDAPSKTMKGARA